VSRGRTAQLREENEVEFSRIVAFSDGVFAIAITLLVLNLSVPEHIHGDDLNEVLWEQRQDLLAYVISFAVIGRFWIVHHRFFASVVGFDAADARRAGLAKVSAQEARDGQRRALIVAAVFLASIPVALLDPDVAPFLWLALFADPVGRRVARRRGD
jgi:hypothetical protein